MNKLKEKLGLRALKMLPAHIVYKVLSEQIPNEVKEFEDAVKQGMGMEYLTDSVFSENDIPIEIKKLFLKGMRWKFKQLTGE